MTTMTNAQINEAADELHEAIKNWKVFDHRGEFLAFRMPDAAVNNRSPADGETLTFWRFDSRAAAERFRNRRIVIELAKAKEPA